MLKPTTFFPCLRKGKRASWAGWDVPMVVYWTSYSIGTLLVEGLIYQKLSSEKEEKESLWEGALLRARTGLPGQVYLITYLADLWGSGLPLFGLEATYKNAWKRVKSSSFYEFLFRTHTTLHKGKKVYNTGASFKNKFTDFHKTFFVQHQNPVLGEERLFRPPALLPIPKEHWLVAEKHEKRFIKYMELFTKFVRNTEPAKEAGTVPFTDPPTFDWETPYTPFYFLFRDFAFVAVHPELIGRFFLDHLPLEDALVFWGYTFSAYGERCRFLRDEGMRRILMQLLETLHPTATTVARFVYEHPSVVTALGLSAVSPLACLKTVYQRSFERIRAGETDEKLALLSAIAEELEGLEKKVSEELSSFYKGARRLAPFSFAEQDSLIAERFKLPTVRFFMPAMRTEGREIFGQKAFTMGIVLTALEFSAYRAEAQRRSEREEKAETNEQEPLELKKRSLKFYSHT